LSTFWQAIQSYQAESDTELNLSAGDYIVVRKVVLSHTRQNSLLLSLAQVHGPFRNLLIAHVTYLLQPASQRKIGCSFHECLNHIVLKLDYWIFI